MAKELVLKYNIIPKTIRQFTSVEIVKNCNSITITNVGATLANINTWGFPLNPGVPGTSNGDSIAVGGNKGEIYAGRLEISFPTTGAGEVVIMQKVYLPDQPLDNE